MVPTSQVVEEMNQSSGVWSLPKPEPTYLFIFLFTLLSLNAPYVEGTVLGAGKTDKWMKYKIMSFNMPMF